MAKTNWQIGDVFPEDFVNGIYLTDGGHKHDGVDADGHAGKIVLTGGAEVTGVLPVANTDLSALGGVRILPLAFIATTDAAEEFSFTPVAGLTVEQVVGISAVILPNGILSPRAHGNGNTQYHFDIRLIPGIVDPFLINKVEIMNRATPAIGDTFRITIFYM